jgi:hypothetical protein
LRSDDNRNQAEGIRAGVFYAVVALLVCGVVGGVGWIIHKSGETKSAPASIGRGDPFVKNSPTNTTLGPGISASQQATTAAELPQNQVLQGQATSQRIMQSGDRAPETVILGPGGEISATNLTAPLPANAQQGATPGAEVASAAGGTTRRSEGTPNLPRTAERFGGVARPQLPSGLLEGLVATDVLQVDLTKEDLGKFIAGQKLPNGVEIIATGSGNRLSSPIVIQNICVRLKFEQTDGAPLVVSPRAAEGGPRNDAFITVRNGGLTIEGGSFFLGTGERSGGPRWFASAVDSDVAFKCCRIKGPLAGNARNRGLIQWLRSDGRPPPRLFAANLDAYAVLDECYLLGSGTLVEADLPQRGLFIRNSLLVSTDDLLSIGLRGIESHLAGTVDLESSTFSAAGTTLRWAAAALSASGPAALKVFADRCVFGPPLRPAGQKPPTLLSYSGPLFETKQIQWREYRCGYSPDIASFVREETAAVESQDFQHAWLDRWGTERVTEPLTGPRGVLVGKELPQRAEDRARLEPTDFTLHASSQAARWDGGDRPIGAPLATLCLPSTGSVSAPPPTKSKGTKTAPPTRGTSPPGF